MANPPKTERNKVIVQLRRGGFGFKRIGKLLDIHFTTAKAIYDREANRPVDNTAEKPLDEE